jgi:hypothetical protein
MDVLEFIVVLSQTSGMYKSVVMGAQAVRDIAAVVGQLAGRTWKNTHHRHHCVIYYLCFAIPVPIHTVYVRLKVQINHTVHNT